MKRNCEGCGTSYEAKRVTSRYCGSTCRTRASRAGTSGPKPAAAPVAEAVEPAAEAKPTPINPDDLVLSVAARTIAELEAAERLHTSLGQVAVVLATRLDNSYRDTGSAAASLARQHAAQMALALAGANREESPVGKAKDELARRRAKRSA